MEHTEDLPGQLSPNDPEYNYTCTNSKPKLFNQKKLNDLIRGLNLSKVKSEILPSRLKENNLLERDVKISYYRKLLTYHTTEKMSRYHTTEKMSRYHTTEKETLI